MFELGLKECSVFNRQKQKQLLLGAQLMFAEGINEGHRCEVSSAGVGWRDGEKRHTTVIE